MEIADSSRATEIVSRPHIWKNKYATKDLTQKASEGVKLQTLIKYLDSDDTAPPLLLSLLILSPPRSPLSALPQHHKHDPNSVGGLDVHLRQCGSEIVNEART